MRLIVATNNKDKMREIRQILSGYFDEILSMSEAGFDLDIEENGSSFAENAMIKAETVFKLSGEAVLADDSGLCVDALDGGPGIFSARYSGYHADPEENNQKLMRDLLGITSEKRGAAYKCAMVLLRPGKAPIVEEGSCSGVIGTEEVGANGFGYDPLFYLPQYGCTMAQLPSEEKNRISHRFLALQGVMKRLEGEKR